MANSPKKEIFEESNSLLNVNNNNININNNGLESMLTSNGLLPNFESNLTIDQQNIFTYKIDGQNDPFVLNRVVATNENDSVGKNNKELTTLFKVEDFNGTSTPTVYYNYGTNYDGSCLENKITTGQYYQTFNDTNYYVSDYYNFNNTTVNMDPSNTNLVMMPFGNVANANVNQCLFNVPSQQIKEENVHHLSNGNCPSYYLTTEQQTPPQMIGNEDGKVNQLSMNNKMDSSSCQPVIKSNFIYPFNVTSVVNDNIDQNNNNSNNNNNNNNNNTTTSTSTLSTTTTTTNQGDTNVSELEKKLHLKRERNRIAARKCRNKKLTQIQQYEERIKELGKLIKQHQEDIAKMTNRKAQLRAIFIQYLLHNSSQKNLITMP